MYGMSAKDRMAMFEKKGDKKKPTSTGPKKVGKLSLGNNKDTKAAKPEPKTTKANTKPGKSETKKSDEKAEDVKEKQIKEINPDTDQQKKEEEKKAAEKKKAEKPEEAPTTPKSTGEAESDIDLDSVLEANMPGQPGGKEPPKKAEEKPKQAVAGKPEAVKPLDDQVKAVSVEPAAVSVEVSPAEPSEQKEAKQEAPATKTAEPSKPATAQAKPVEPAKPAAAQPKPAEPAKSTAAQVKPAEPAKPAAAQPKPAEPAKPAATQPKPAEPAKPAATQAKPAEPAKPAAAQPKPAGPDKPAAAQPEPAQPAKPAAAPAKPAELAKAAAPQAKPGEPAKPAAAQARPAQPAEAGAAAQKPIQQPIPAAAERKPIAPEEAKPPTIQKQVESEVKPTQPTVAKEEKVPKPKFTPISEDFYNTIFYFLGMGNVVGSALAEGVYVPSPTANAALNAEDVTDVKNKRMGKGNEERETIIQTARHQANDLSDELRNLQALLETLPTFLDPDAEAKKTPVQRQIDHAIQARYQQFQQQQQQQPGQAGAMPAWQQAQREKAIPAVGYKVPGWKEQVQEGLQIMGHIPSGAQPALPGARQAPMSAPFVPESVKQQQAYIERLVQQQIQEYKERKELEALAAAQPSTPEPESVLEAQVQAEAETEAEEKAQAQAQTQGEAMTGAGSADQAQQLPSTASEGEAAMAGKEEVAAGQEAAPVTLAVAEPVAELEIHLAAPEEPQAEVHDTSEMSAPVVFEIVMDAEVTIGAEPVAPAAQAPPAIAAEDVPPETVSAPPASASPPPPPPPPPALPLEGMGTKKPPAGAVPVLPGMQLPQPTIAPQPPSPKQEFPPQPQAPEHPIQPTAAAPATRPSGESDQQVPQPEPAVPRPYGVYTGEPRASTQPSWQEKYADKKVEDVSAPTPFSSTGEVDAQSLKPWQMSHMRAMEARGITMTGPKQGLERDFFGMSLPEKQAPLPTSELVAERGGKYAPRENQPRAGGARPYGVHTELEIESKPYQEKYRDARVEDASRPKPFVGAVSTRGLKPWQMSHLRTLEAQGMVISDADKPIEKDFFSMTLSEKQAPEKGVRQVKVEDAKKPTPFTAAVSTEGLKPWQMSHLRTLEAQGRVIEPGRAVEKDFFSMTLPEKQAPEKGIRQVKVEDAKKPRPFSASVTTQGLKPWQMSHVRTLEAQGVSIGDPQKRVESDFFAMTLPEKQAPLPSRDVETLAPFLVSRRSKEGDIENAFRKSSASTQYRSISSQPFDFNAKPRAFGSATDSLAYSDL